MQNNPTTVAAAPPTVGFFQENNGNYSSMRLMSFVSLMAAIGFGIITILRGEPEGTYITFGFLIGAFAPKAVQKFAEQNLER